MNSFFNDNYCPYTTNESAFLIHRMKEDTNGPRFGKKRKTIKKKPSKKKTVSKKTKTQKVKKVSYYEN